MVEQVLRPTGKELSADVIITATGFILQIFGGIELFVDGKKIDPAKTTSYKGVMFSDIPNFANVFGYINASWTLKADMISYYVTRLLNYMDKNGIRQMTPRLEKGANNTVNFLGNFLPGYITRSLDQLPKQGSEAPWISHQDFLKDFFLLNFGAIKDHNLEEKK
jgi:cation diffusion facilitator CzcD-associated flavoprotein CzcO